MLAWLLAALLWQAPAPPAPPQYLIAAADGPLPTPFTDSNGNTCWVTFAYSQFPDGSIDRLREDPCTTP